MGSRLLEQSLKKFAVYGATDVIALLDHDPPGTGQAHPAAGPLLRAGGFGEIDLLHTYIRRP